MGARPSFHSFIHSSWWCDPTTATTTTTLFCRQIFFQADYSCLGLPRVLIFSVCHRSPFATPKVKQTKKTKQRYCLLGDTVQRYYPFISFLSCSASRAAGTDTGTVTGAGLAVVRIKSETHLLYDNIHNVYKLLWHEQHHHHISNCPSLHILYKVSQVKHYIPTGPTKNSFALCSLWMTTKRKIYSRMFQFPLQNRCMCQWLW